MPTPDPPPTPIGASQLVRSLLPLLPGGRAASAELVAVGGYLGFSENAIRVALTRLLKAGWVEVVQRGVYRMSNQGGPLVRVASRWRLDTRRTTPWDGRWAGVFLPRTRPSRTERRHSDRALRTLHFGQVAEDLWVRPVHPLLDDTFRRALRALGLESGAIEVELRPTDDDGGSWPDAWDGGAIDDRYVCLADEIRTRHQQIRERDVPRVLRESFLYGRAWIREVAFDPWLPWTDGDARHAMVQALQAYDAACFEIWRLALMEVGVRLPQRSAGPRAFAGLPGDVAAG